MCPNLKNNFKWDGIKNVKTFKNYRQHCYSKYNANNHPKFKEVT